MMSFSAILSELEVLKLSYKATKANTNTYYTSLGYVIRPNGTIIKEDGYKNKALYYMENDYKCLIPTWDLYLIVLGIQEFDAIPEGHSCDTKC